MKFSTLVNLFQESIDLPPPNVIVKAESLSSLQQNILATLLVKEAGGEHSTKSMVAIMNTIQNRAHRDPNNFTSVALSPNQYSCFNNITNNPIKLIELINNTKEHSSYKEALRIVQLASKGKLKDITNGATHYHVFKGASAVAPYWTSPKYGGKNSKAIPTCVFGSHVFLKNV